MENSIVPLCLYSNGMSSYIGLPNKQDNTYVCPIHPTMFYVTTFYVINPDTRPKPTYSDLFCVKNTESTTISITTLYDPFDIDINCFRFIAWLETTPNTIPLFLYKRGENLYISLKQEDLPPYTIPSLYVLKTPMNFSDSFGRCIPDPNSTLTLQECVVQHNKNILQPEKIGIEPNVISYLENRYGKKLNYKKGKNIMFVLSSILVVVIFIFLFITLIRYKNGK